MGGLQEQLLLGLKLRGIEYIHNQTQMAFEYLSALRAAAEQKAEAIVSG